MTRSLLGCHWIRVHPDGRDLSHVEAMQYKSVKMFEWHWSDRNACRDLLTVLPSDSYILARDHPLSEQPIWSDPEGIGVRQANEWAMKVAMGQYHLPVERTFFLGRNEPDATTGDRGAIDRYTAAFLNRLKVHGLRGGAFNFSTGHPRTVDGTGNTPADYTVFESSHQAIVEGHHIGVLHIYGTAAVPCAPGHYDRLKACTWQDVEWVVGEMGSDQHVVGGGAHDGYIVTFAGRLQEYCRWLDTLIMGINDPRIHSYQVFSYDFSHPWSSFDVREIRGALEICDWQHVKQAPTPAPPPIPTGAAFVRAMAGANIRSAPITGDVLIAAPYATRVEILGYDAASRWFRVRWNGVEGFMQGALLVVERPDPVVPAPAPVPVPADKWARSIAWTLKWEGGLSVNPEDHGNWTGGRKGQGELKGTNFGISAASYPTLDIRNLTKEQAIAIYERDYWHPSGAAALDWPACLLVFDSAVLHGVGTAQTWLAEVGPDPYRFAAKRLRLYTKLDNWAVFGIAWVRRTADLLEAMQP